MPNWTGKKALATVSALTVTTLFLRRMILRETRGAKTNVSSTRPEQSEATPEKAAVA